MKTTRFQGMLLTAALLLTSLPILLVGCGGTSSAPAGPVTPADTTPPTVTISGTSATAITAPATLNFSFSEDVGTSFTASDVTITNGTAGTFTKVDATHYTLVVTPPVNAAGTMTVSVAAGSFSDLAGNMSTVLANASQPYNTVVVVISYPVVDFNTAGLTYKATDFGGTLSTFPAVGAPAGGPTTPVVKIIKTTGANTWGGTTLSVGYLDSVGTMPFSATNKKLTAKVYSPAAGISFKLKVEDAQNGSNAVETDATAAAGWQTLTFDMATPTATTPALNLAFTYNKVSIFPHFGTSPSADETYYVGPISFLGAAAPSAPPLSPAVDVTPPTLIITGPGGTATGAATFTFTFSEDIGTSFDITDVVVTGGTPAAAVTKVDATHYTLVVTPPAASTGNIVVSVAIGAYKDLANNLNTASSNATQGYNTGAVVGHTLANFDEVVAPVLSPFEGADSATIVADPTGGTNNVARVSNAITANPWAGVTVSTGYLNSIAQMFVTATDTKMTARVYSPAVGLKVRAKAENAENPAQNHETDAVTTVAGAWETLTWDFKIASPLFDGLPSNPFNATDTYNKLSFFFDYGTKTAARVFYLDDVTFLGAIGVALVPPPPPAVPTTLPAAPTLLAANVISLWNSSATYTNVTVDNWNPGWGQGGSIDPITVATKAIWKMNLVNYQGIAISSGGGLPTGTGVLNITGKNHLHISYWTPNGTILKFSPINATAEYAIDCGTITQGAWTDLEITINQGGFDLTTIRQLKFDTTAAGTFYLDNIYFH